MTAEVLVTFSVLILALVLVYYCLDLGLVSSKTVSRQGLLCFSLCTVMSHVVLRMAFI